MDTEWDAPGGAPSDDASTVGTQFSRALAVIGIVVGTILVLGFGLLAWWNYSGWKKGRDRYPLIPWYLAWWAIIGLIGALVSFAVGGLNEVSRFGGPGTLVMFAGGVAATALTWYLDQIYAEHPTLKGIART